MPVHSFPTRRSSDLGITFDLEAIRQANPGWKLLRFRVMTGNTEFHSRLFDSHNSADLWVFVDGQERFKRKNINGYSGGAPVAVTISDRDRYLTLVGTDGGDGIAADWIIFGDPRLEMIYEAKAASDREPNTSQPAAPNGEEVHRK
jgi:hypothetical protein